MIMIGIGGAENGHPFFGRRIIEQKSCIQKLWPKEKEPDLKYLSFPQKSQSFDKNSEF